MKILLIPLLLAGLGACDFLDPLSADGEVCRNIALHRLKHPDSFDRIALEEKAVAPGLVDISLSFNAWNGYKVPMAHNITCRFRAAPETAHTPDPSRLISITWNRQQLRRHELDELRSTFMPR